MIQIMFGVLTCASALLGYVLVPNFPAKATFLSEDEKELIQNRITVDRHDFEEEKMNLRIALRHLGNWKIWW